MRVAAVTPDSPAEGLITKGSILTQLHSGDTAIPLKAELLMHPFLGQGQAEHPAYARWTLALRQTLEAGKPITLASQRGEHLTLTPAIHMPVHAIPAGFWFFSIIFLLVPGSCLLVWRHKAFTREGWLLLAAGAAYYIFFLILALIEAREISLGVWEQRLATMQWLMLLIFMPSLILLTLYYPLHPHSARPVWFLLTAMIVMGGNAFFSWLDFALHDSFLLQLAWLLTVLLFVAQRQVRQAFGRPLEYAAARVMQLALMPLFFITMLFFLPLALHMTPLISAWFLPGLAALVFSGLAVTLLRYRLYDMEYVWFYLWLWLLAGSMVILLAILLIWPVGLPNTYAMGTAMVLGVFLCAAGCTGSYCRWMDSPSIACYPCSARPSQAPPQPQAFANSLGAVPQQRFAPRYLRKLKILVRRLS
ncbi:MAG: hypothetical protein R3E89_17340 [Thiolinea sp.]